jgi:hypothetical protein
MHLLIILSPGFIALFVAVMFFVLLLVLNKPKFPARYHVADPGEKSQIDLAVDELYSNFEGMDIYFQRMTENEFRAYCHSQISGGIGMKIRNMYSFWEMFLGKKEKSDLYLELCSGMPGMHPDTMSSQLIARVYQRYWAEHPEAKQELDRFQEFKKTPKYRPVYPFDVHYPEEKSYHK